MTSTSHTWACLLNSLCCSNASLRACFSSSASVPSILQGSTQKISQNEFVWCSLQSCWESSRYTTIQILYNREGVFFRKYTQEHAKSLGLVGYVRNASDGSVEGDAQGNVDNIDQMLVKVPGITDVTRKHWLQNVGSPKSRIDRTELESYCLQEVTYQSFSIRYWTKQEWLFGVQRLSTRAQ